MRWRNSSTRARSATSASRKRSPRTCAAPLRCIRSRACRASTRCWSAAWRAEILDTCEELGIGFLPFSPLLRGLLAGSLTATTELEPGDFRAADRFPRVGPEHLAANAELAEVVVEIADAHDASPSQVALAWLLGRHAVDRADPGHQAHGLHRGQRRRTGCRTDANGPGAPGGPRRGRSGRALRRRPGHTRLGIGST